RVGEDVRAAAFPREGDRFVEMLTRTRALTPDPDGAPDVDQKLRARRAVLGAFGVEARQRALVVGCGLLVREAVERALRRAPAVLECLGGFAERGCLGEVVRELVEMCVRVTHLECLRDAPVQTQSTRRRDLVVQRRAPPLRPQTPRS